MASFGFEELGSEVSHLRVGVSSLSGLSFRLSVSRRRGVTTFIPVTSEVEVPVGVRMAAEYTAGVLVVPPEGRNCPSASK